jgi:sugar phosphate isomerase/epimerase
MRFGASVWPWRWDAPYERAIKRIGDAGFRAVELIAWNDEALEMYYTPETVKALRAVLDGEDMRLSQFVVKNEGLASADAATRKASIDEFKRGAGIGIELGATVINTVVHFPFGIKYPELVDRPLMQEFTVDMPSGLDWKQNWTDYIDGLRECAAFAESAGVHYSLEPHPFRYGANTEGLLRILEAVDSPALGINFDPSHLFAVGDVPHVVLERLAGRILHCHFSDNDGVTNAHWRPGRGKIDWRSVLRSLKNMDYTGVISLEFEDIPGVSRGVHDTHGAYRGNVDATDGFEQEYRLALAFLTELAHEVGLKVE